MPSQDSLIGFPESESDRPYRPCVGIMLVNKDGLVWAGKRDDGSGQSTYDYAWQMPQGGIDLSEDPLVAAKRELYEETSVRSVSLLAESAGWLTYDYPADVQADTRKGRYRGQAQKWFALRFEGTDDEINVLQPPDGHSAEFSEWRWERAANLPNLIVPFKRPVYTEIIAEFSAFTA